MGYSTFSYNFTHIVSEPEDPKPEASVKLLEDEEREQGTV
jgi:hypothetical protein